MLASVAFIARNLPYSYTSLSLFAAQHFDRYLVMVKLFFIIKKCHCNRSQIDNSRPISSLWLNKHGVNHRFFCLVKTFYLRTRVRKCERLPDFLKILFTSVRPRTIWGSSFCDCDNARG